jgi:hypothetical protein
MWFPGIKRAVNRLGWVVESDGRPSGPHRASDLVKCRDDSGN